MADFTPHQNVGDFDQDCLFFDMEPTLDSSAPRALFLENPVSPAFWPWQHPLEGPNALFGEHTSLYPGNDFPRIGASPTMNFGRGSSHSSDQSSSGSAPSSITSYNEHDMANTFSGTPPPRSPQYDRTQSPTSMYPDVAPLSGCGQPLEVGGPVIPATAPLASSTSELVTCPECCTKKTFGRKFELRRHINEQHRCPHEDCGEVKFQTQKEKRDHEASHSENGLGYRCGLCILYGSPSKPLTRAEKLKKHFREFHLIVHSFDFTDFQCKEKSCSPSKTYGGLFFISQDTLAQHQRQLHGKTVELPTISRVDSKLEDPTNSNIGKRPSSSATSSESKRWKVAASENKTISYVTLVPKETDSGSIPRSSSVQTPSHHRADPLSEHDTSQQLQCSKPRGSALRNYEPTTQLEETFHLSMMQMRALTKLEDWNSFLEKLQALNVSAVFDNSNTAIKLRSSSTANLQTGNLRLQRLMSDIQATTLDLRQEEPMTQKAAFHQQVSVRPQPEISTLDATEDAEVIALWTNRLLERFPSIVREAGIDGSYSISLVRQKILGHPRPIIRFRSSENQSTLSRRIFRKIVEKLCAEYMHDPLPVHFSQGNLVRLVGGTFDAAVMDDPSDDYRFPHERRFYPKLGMGSSIGISGCSHVSATSGGFVKVSNRVYMLTVDHLLSACECFSSFEVQSPSQSDTIYVQRQAVRKLRELMMRIQHNTPGELPLNQVAERLFSRDIDEEISQYLRIKKDSERRPEDFVFGTVHERSGVGQPVQRKSINPHSREEVHRMDWSLIDITASHRKGKNVHRYARPEDPSLHDIRMEIMKPEGTGTPCIATRNVGGNEHVHYVGTTSGFRQGSVHPALVQHRDFDGTISNEWAMHVEGCEQLRDTDFQGDSGAWIISADNKLLGQLWGWDNGNLLFTPIVDVFADVAQKMGLDTHAVTLPDYPSPKAEHQDGLLCRISTDALPAVFEEFPDHETAKFQDLALLSPMSIPTRGRSTRASSWCSVGSIPSLMSSVSSASEGIESPRDTMHQLSPSTPEPMHTLEMQHLPTRTKSPILPRVSIEEWVYVLPDGINQKLSTLQLAKDASGEDSTCDAVPL